MKKLLILCVLCLSIILAGCSSNSSTKSSSQSSVTNNTTSTATTTTQDMTLQDLKKYNGQNGNPAYVAVSGVIYDVTNAKDWNNGKHKGYSAGEDLTKAIADAPHGTSVLKGLTVVGKVIK